MISNFINQDSQSKSVKRLEQFKWEKYYFSVDERKGFFFLICTEGSGNPTTEIFVELQNAFFTIFKDQFILLGDLLKNAGPTKHEKRRLSVLIDQVVKTDTVEQYPKRKIPLTDIYMKKGNCRKLNALKEQIQTMAVLLQCSGSSSIKEISEFTNLKEQHVKTILQTLNKLDLIEIPRRDGSNIPKRVRL